MDAIDRTGADQRRREIPAAAVLILPFVVAVAVGLPSVDGSFIRDDWDYVSGNPHVVCHATPRDVFKAPFQPLKPLGLYRPVTTLSLRLDACLGGEARPWIFHATNLLLAGAGALLVAWLAKTLVLQTGRPGGATRAALVAGLLFAVHPARTEAVCWVSGRAESLMTFFALLALLFASGREALWRTVLAAVCAVLAAWSKEQGFVLALLVPIFAPPVTGKRVVQMIGVAAALGLAFIARFGVLEGTALRPGLAVFEGLGFPDRVAQGFRLLFEAVRVTVWPHPLTFEYDTPSLRASGFGDLRVLLGALMFVALGAAMLPLRRAPLLARGAALFLLPLIPVLSVFVPIGEDFAERFVALPVAGAALVLGGLAARFPVAGFGAGMLLVAICGPLFVLRASDYRSERTLYEATLARAPESPAAMTLVASSLLVPDGGTRRPQAKDVARAEQLLRAAVAKDPGSAPARMTLSALEAQRRAPTGLKPLPAEVEFLMETARRFPNVPQASGMLGVALFERGATEMARDALARELVVMPLDVTAATTLARILDEQKDHAGAQAVIEAVRARWLALWQRFPGFAPVAITYARTLSDGARDVDGARTVLRQAAAAACRASDRRAIDAALVEIGGK